MRVETQSDPDVQVIIKKVARDKDKKLTYSTERTVNVYETTPEEVAKVVVGALNAAPKK